MDIDYTCFTCGRDHPLVPGYPSQCPFGGPRAAKPDRQPTAEELRAAAMADIALRDQIEARQRREAEAARDRAWARISAEIKEVMAIYRQAEAARREASATEAHELMISTRRGEAWERRVE